MGGRGARLGYRYVNGGKVDYGMEYETLAEYENIKFVKYKLSNQATAPMETKTKNRIYVTVNDKNEIKYISFYDSKGKRQSQIDVSGKPHTINGRRELPHVHLGYEHNENGNRVITNSEKLLVDKVKNLWKDRDKQN